MIENAIQIICVYAIPLIFAITLHEAAHGWAAKKLGDDTAWILGRVTAGPSPCRSIRVTSGTSTAT